MSNQYDNILNKISRDELMVLVENSSGYYDILRKLGYTGKNLRNSCRRLKTRLVKENINLDCFNKRKRSPIWKMPIKDDKIKVDYEGFMDTTKDKDKTTLWVPKQMVPAIKEFIKINSPGQSPSQLHPESPGLQSENIVRTVSHPLGS